MSKYGHRPHNWFEAIVNKLGGEEGAERFLRNELTVSEDTLWHEENGVIRCSVVSDGTTGEDWIKRLEGNGFRVEKKLAKSVLRSPDFKPTKGLTTEVAILKGILIEGTGWDTDKIRTEADKRRLSKPNAEVGCLLREKFTDKEIQAMGLWYIIAMHEPIAESGGVPSLLSADRDVEGRRLRAYYDRPGRRWDRYYGFAFAVSPSSQP